MNNLLNFFNDGTVKLLAQVKDFFSSYQFKEIVFTVKFIFIIASIILLLAIVLLIISIVFKSMLVKPLIKSKKPEPAFNKKKIKKRWQGVERRIKTGLEANYKLALLEADNIFNRVMKEIGYDKQKKLSNADDIKAAGKLNGKVIEEKKLKLSKEEVEKAVNAYKKGLEELGVL